MRSLPRPVIDDVGILDTLTSTPTLQAMRLLLPIKDDLAAGYASYEAAAGNIEQVPPLGLRASRGKELRRLYGRPPAYLAYIRAMREEAAHDGCAMCGGHGVTTLEHVFPKATYPEYAVFSANLVPACSCNHRRGTKSHGGLPGQRILHPYFDGILRRRLVSARFEDWGQVPSLCDRWPAATHWLQQWPSTYKRSSWPIGSTGGWATDGPRSSDVPPSSSEVWPRRRARTTTCAPSCAPNGLSWMTYTGQGTPGKQSSSRVCTRPRPQGGSISR